MGQWQVRGADRTSGHDVGQIYDATTRDDALTMAVGDGMMVEAVELLVDDGPSLSEPLDELDRALRREAAQAGAPHARAAGPRPMSYAMPRAAAAPAYSGLAIAAHVLRVLAAIFYLFTLLALWEIFAESSAIEWKSLKAIVDSMLGMFWPLAAAAIGAIMHALGSACFALRDIARNSWR